MANCRRTLGPIVPWGPGDMRRIKEYLLPGHSAPVSCKRQLTARLGTSWSCCFEPHLVFCEAIFSQALRVRLWGANTWLRERGYAISSKVGFYPLNQEESQQLPNPLGRASVFNAIMRLAMSNKSYIQVRYDRFLCPFRLRFRLTVTNIERSFVIVV